MKALRRRDSNHELRRRSTFDPSNILRNRVGEPSSRYSVDNYRSGTGSILPDRDDARPPTGHIHRMEAFADPTQRSSMSPARNAAPAHHRFSILRSKNASEPQLSAKARAQAAGEIPPVPDMPAAPAIITTAPTTDERTHPPPKKKQKFQPFAKAKQSFELSLRPAVHRKSTDRKSRAFDANGNGHFRMEDLEDPARLSTSSARVVTTDTGRRPASSLSIAPSKSRLSLSSKNEYVDLDHHNAAPVPPMRPTLRNHNTFSWFPRKHKHRASLFPLPVQIPPQEFPDTAPSTPRPSSAALSAASPTHSPGGFSPPHASVTRSRSATDIDQQYPVPLNTPTNTFAASSVSFTAPGTAVLRNNSVRSIHSSTSSPARKQSTRPKNRARSSTLNSTSSISNDMHPRTPEDSARNSTSTAGRSSFSLWGFSRKHRENSNPHSPGRHGSPALGQPATPGGASHQNSMSISRADQFVLPEREEGESPGRYLSRIEDVLDRRKIPAVLSKRTDDFFVAVLRSFMRQYAFFGDPIDMAIRKLLMQTELPRETQQIDRVLDSFAARYHECNPGIFMSKDEAFYIAFSILVLNTDLHNANNKRKMTKQQYVKSCKDKDGAESVSADVIECFYDNIAYTPFIEVEEDADSRKGPKKSRKTKVKGGFIDPSAKAHKGPIDPYTLILDSDLDVLRPPIKDILSLEDPYTYLGTAQKLDLVNLSRKCGMLKRESEHSRPDAFADYDKSTGEFHFGEKLGHQKGVVEIPVEKVGILLRKDTKRKAGRSPWKEWGAILTGKGLNLFRDPSLAKIYANQHKAHIDRGHGDTPVIFEPAITSFNPDEVIEPDRIVALLDASYRKHKHSFCIISMNRTEEFFRAESDAEMNDWLARLNYQAAYRSVGIRPRGLVGGNYEGQRQRGIRRLDSSATTRSVPTATGDVTIRSGKIDTQLAQQISTARRDKMQDKIGETEELISTAIRRLDSQLRDARHLQILAPIQQKTRENVVHAAGRTAAQLKWVRIEVWRMKAHRDILAMDLEEERRRTEEATARIQKISGVPSSTTSELPKEALERRSSMTSGGTNGQLPHSPTTSVRPQTKSSLGTAGGEDVFMTPPDDRRTSAVSPHHRPSQSITSTTSGPSLVQSSHAHRPSVSSAISDVPSHARSESSAYHTPTAGEDEEEEEDGVDESLQTLRQPPADLRPTTPPATDASVGAPSTGSPGSRKPRRSFQRTLRETRDSPLAHHRSKKGKDSVGSIPASDGATDADGKDKGLSRAKGSFTIHGKKASVITFGSEWEDMSAEERLNMRRRAHLSDNSMLSVPNMIPDGSEPAPERSAREGSLNSDVLSPVSVLSGHTGHSALERQRSHQSSVRSARPSSPIAEAEGSPQSATGANGDMTSPKRDTIDEEEQENGPHPGMESSSQPQAVKA